MADKLTSLLSDVQNLVNISYEVVKSGGKTTEAASLLTLADKIVAEVQPRYVPYQPCRCADESPEPTKWRATRKTMLLDSVTIFQRAARSLSSSWTVCIFFVRRQLCHESE